MCCTRLTGNTRRKNYAKTQNRHLRTIAQLCLARSSQLKHVLTIGKNLLNTNISSTSPHNKVNGSQLAAEIDWWVWGTPANFNQFRILDSLLHWRRSMKVNELCTMFGCLLLVHYIYIFGGSCPNGILPRTKLTLSPSLVFSYTGRVTAWHSRSERQPNCGVQQRAPPIFGRAAIMLGIGPYSSFILVFYPPLKPILDFKFFNHVSSRVEGLKSG